MSDLAIRMGIPEEVWDDFHNARELQDAAVADMQGAFQRYLRCRRSRARFVPGMLLYKSRVYKKSTETFDERRDLLAAMERKVPVIDVSVGGAVTDSENVAIALRLLKNAYDCYTSAWSHAILGSETKKVKKMKLEWTMCHHEVMNGFYCLQEAREADRSLRIFTEIKAAADVHGALGLIAAELTAGDLGDKSFPDFEQVMMELMSLRGTLDTTMSWQYLKQSRLPGK